MWLKAASADTYTTWSQHLWRLLAEPSTPLLGAGYRGDSESVTVGDSDSAPIRGSGAGAIGRSALNNRYVQQAIGFEGHTGSLGESTGETPVTATRETVKREAKPDQGSRTCRFHKATIAIGLKRDTEILSEKNILITAVKKRDVSYDVKTWQNHAKGAQRRYLILGIMT